jgi:UDP-glucuronate decarboxylase
MFNKKTALVVGGAGFIGSFLCERLLKDGRRVICLDNFVSSELVNIEQLLKDPDFEFIRKDVSEPLDLDGLPELRRFSVAVKGVQEVYYVPAPMTAKKFEERRIELAKTLSTGLFNTLDWSLRFKPRFLLGSTSAIYGARPLDDHRVSEDEFGLFSHLTPRACKDEGRRWAETVAFTYALEFGLDIRIARLFRTYGPRMQLDDGQMIPDFIMNALSGEDLVVHGDIHDRTSLIYVADVVDGMVKIMEERSNPGPVNIGSDYDLRIVDIAQKIIDLTGSSSKISFGEPPSDRTQRPLPDLRRAKETLGWMPMVPLEQGLKNSIEYAVSRRYRSKKELR